MTEADLVKKFFEVPILDNRGPFLAAHNIQEKIFIFDGRRCQLWQFGRPPLERQKNEMAG